MGLLVGAGTGSRVGFGIGTRVGSSVGGNVGSVVGDGVGSVLHLLEVGVVLQIVVEPLSVRCCRVDVTL